MDFQPNFLYPTGFIFKLSRTPEVEYTVQAVSIPGLTLGIAEQATPFTKLTNPGHISYGQFSVEFLVQQDIKNYLELFTWMRQLGTPETWTEYNGSKYDASIIILDGHKKTCGSFEVKFTDVFPTSLSDLNLDVRLDNPGPVSVTATFTFDTMNFY